MQISDLMLWIGNYLAEHPELLKAKYRNAEGRHPLFGHCYVASEAFLHLRPDLDLHPVTMRIDDDVHWWLVDDEGVEYDITRDQYEGNVALFEGTGRGFLTKKPSRRAQQVIDAFRREHPGRYEVWVRQYICSALKEENRILGESEQKDLAQIAALEQRLDTLLGNSPVLH